LTGVDDTAKYRVVRQKRADSMATNQHLEQRESKDQLVCQLELLETRSRLALSQVETRARDLEAGLRRLSQLYKHSPIAFVSFDEGARIVDVNPAAARLLQISPASVLGLSFSVLVADKTSTSLVDHLRRVRRSGEAVKTELALITGQCRRLPAEIISCPVPLDTGRVYETAIIDLTERRAAAEAIRVSNEYAQSIVATIPFPVLVLDAHGRVTCTNSAFTRVFETNESQVVTWPVSELPGIQWHSVDLEKSLMRALKDGEIIEEFVFAAELRRGSLLWLQLTARRLSGKTDSGPQLLVTFEDITRRKRAEEERLVLFTELESSRALLEQRVEERTEQLAKSYTQLRSLGEQLVLAHESEQRRIARELHDQIGQDLTALKMILRRARDAQPDQSKAGLAEAETVLEELLRTVRNICGTLRPQVLDDLGLIPGLEFHIKNFSARTGLQINFDFGPFPQMRLDPMVESAIFRVIQEALTNVSRHAHTDSASVMLAARHGHVQFSIRDGGRGFDLAEVMKRGSTGVSSMRERLSLVHGTFEIASSPGNGTIITAQIPVSTPTHTQPTNGNATKTPTPNPNRKPNGKSFTGQNSRGRRSSPRPQGIKIPARQ
jgi:PAS domain S-box-containing protein